MQKRYKKDDNNLTYAVKTYPLNTVNLQDFENTLNENAMEGWRLKHTFITALKIVTIWEK